MPPLPQPSSSQDPVDAARLMADWFREGDWMAAAEPADVPQAPVLVFDGGCPFCRHFAELSELRAGIPGLQIRDGRSEHALRRALAARGYALHSGAMVLDQDRVLHGADAIAWLCGRMRPSAALLQLLAPLFADRVRARRLYPGLLLLRRLALALRRLPLDPEERLGSDARRLSFASRR